MFSVDAVNRATLGRIPLIHPLTALRTNTHRTYEKGSFACGSMVLFFLSVTFRPAGRKVTGTDEKIHYERKPEYLDADLRAWPRPIAGISVDSSRVRIHNRSITIAGWFDSPTSTARIRNVILQLLYHKFVIYFHATFTALVRYACSNLAKPMLS
jgi:hypothetical protein